MCRVVPTIIFEWSTLRDVKSGVTACDTNLAQDGTNSKGLERTLIVLALLA